MPIPKDTNLIGQLYDSSLEAMKRQMMADRERLERARNTADWGDDRR